MRRTLTHVHIWLTEYTLCRMFKEAVSKAAASEDPEAYPLGYVEGLNDARTMLAGFFSILLEINPELEIHPVLIGVGAQVLLDIRPGKHMAIDRMERQLPLHTRA